MADLTITPLNVKTTKTVTSAVIQFGELVAHGDTVYQKSADKKYWKASADDDETSKVGGVVVIPNIADGQVQKSGLIDLGATLVVGETYAQSATSGKIAPVSDLATGKFVTLLGVSSTSQLVLKISASGTQHA